MNHSTMLFLKQTQSFIGFGINVRSLLVHFI